SPFVYSDLAVQAGMPMTANVRKPL
ncbi:hypothetical protein EVA_07361, partial [gut metagenome]